MSGSINSSNTSLEIIAFYLGSEQFCVETLAIRSQLLPRHTKINSACQ
jgi:chemotaxis signal transduction protein